MGRPYLDDTAWTEVRVVEDPPDQIRAVESTSREGRVAEGSGVGGGGRSDAAKGKRGKGKWARVRVMRSERKIVETKGETEWLKNETPHCHVRRDYYDTDRGVIKMSDVVDVVKDETAPSQCC
jgi:hypothetical protein